MTDLRVLVVEDEPIAAEAHTAYVERVAGFSVAATVGSCQAAIQALQDHHVDVILLDMHLPDRHGLDVLRAVRSAGHRADVIAVTSARELDVVRSAVSLGVMQYVLKPFTFPTLRERLEAYRAYVEQTEAVSSVTNQSEIDQMLGSLRPSRPVELPKGLSQEMLDQVSTVLRGSDVALSARDLAEQLPVSRVTARRYAEHLCDAGLAMRRSRYAGAGRPEVEYRWI
ncbi:transcriptional regulatory protein [Flexivirga endophytica]|uniref:Transcriptional regulatory protein n=1 Tax=Flexivirga endophytica TaxID=1849103 RepID=A0A916TFN7_9MICO|nr:response regulator [Flexivirga endophytica]GGB42264.1 transcriptional regulatory protein [Flexivirga endophytica]GHB70458.1 transcriptional regulatory protein [Flexivirga endophytica]